MAHLRLPGAGDPGLQQVGMTHNNPVNLRRLGDRVWDAAMRKQFGL